MHNSQLEYSSALIHVPQTVTSTKAAIVRIQLWANTLLQIAKKQIVTVMVLKFSTLSWENSITVEYRTSVYSEFNKVYHICFFCFFNVKTL